MEKIKQILDGRKTYIGLIVTLVGILGLSKYITDGETTTLLNSVFEIVGVIIAIYGRAVTKNE